MVTGTGGLGLEAAVALASAGAEVILAGRNPDKGRQAVSEIAARAVGSRARFEQLDLASLESVAAFADRLTGAVAALDILICNAGIMSPPTRRTTAEGLELQFGVNFLGHFALVARLLPLLRNAAAPRVVSVTSLAHRYAKPDFDDVRSERSYNPGKAYCLSKLAQALFAQELQRRSDQAGWGLTSVAAHPGLARTNLFQSDEGKMGPLKSLGTWAMGALLGHSAAAGSAPIVHAATAPARGGELYGPRGVLEMKGPPGLCDFAEPARDRAAGASLWSLSEELAEVRFGEFAGNARARPADRSQSAAGSLVS